MQPSLNLKCSNISRWLSKSIQSSSPQITMLLDLSHQSPIFCHNGNGELLLTCLVFPSDCPPSSQRQGRTRNLPQKTRSAENWNWCWILTVFPKNNTDWSSVRLNYKIFVKLADKLFENWYNCIVILPANIPRIVFTIQFIGIENLAKYLNYSRVTSATSCS